MARAVSRPGVFVFYGRPGSFKTLTSLALASMWRSGTVYVGLGKHAFADKDRFYRMDVKFFSALSFREELNVLLELGGAVGEGGLVVYDGFGSLVFPLYAYPRGHAIYSAGMLVASLLERLSVDRGATVVIVCSEGAQERPSLYSVLRAYVRRYFRFVREGDTVRVEVRDVELTVTGTLSVVLGELLERVEREGATKEL